MRILWLSNRVNRVKTRINETFTLPTRLQGTVVEKWLLYWRSLLKDYSDAGKEIVKGAYNQPRRTLAIGSVGYGCYIAAQNNPNEEKFMELLRNWNNQMIMVPESLQNNESKTYLRQLEVSLNHNRLRFQSLGILTLLWEDKYDKDDCTYAAICDYTRVRFWDVPKHVIDIGFMGNYWGLKWRMRNFDVNYLN